MATFADMGWFSGGFGNTIDDLPPLSQVTSFFFQGTAHEIIIPDGIYEVGEDITRDSADTFRPFSGRLRDDDVVRFAGYEESTGYPVFAFSNVFSQPAYVIVSDVARSGNYEPTGNFITDTAYDIGPQGLGMVRFTNVATFQGDGPAGTYDFLGAPRDIPGGTYMVGDRSKGSDEPITFPFFGINTPVEFVGYQAEKFYPIFRSIDQVNGQHINFLLTDEPTTETQVTLTSDNIITDMPYVTCFAPGTWIATPDGERLVETLKPGDKVLTADCGVETVKWVGVQKVPTMFGAREVTHPVRIMAGALDDNVPHTDLVVTRDHGMIVDGVICHAGALINGTSIVEVSTRELARDRHGLATYYHVETENHVPLLANGAAAESFIDNVDRARFDNHSEFVALYGARVRAMTEMNLPRAMSARQVPRRIALLLDERAAMILPSVAKGPVAGSACQGSSKSA